MIVSPEIQKRIEALWNATQAKLMADHTAKNQAENNFTALSQIDLDELTIEFLTLAATAHGDLVNALSLANEAMTLSAEVLAAMETKFREHQERDKQA